MTSTEVLPSEESVVEDVILVSQPEACRLLSIERTTLWRLVKGGEVDQIKIGGRSLIVRESLDALVRRKSA